MAEKGVGARKREGRKRMEEEIKAPLAKVESIKAERKRMGNRGITTKVGVEVQELLDALPFYVILIDANHRILLANKAVSTVLGVDPEHIIGEYCPKVVHGLDSPFPGCPLEEVVKTGHGIERELFDSRSGRWMNSAVYPTGYRTKEGRAVFFHLAQDITERKQAEEALRESEERYRALLELGGEVGEAVLMLQNTEQGDAIQTFVSDEWLRITGYSRKELLGMSFFDLVHPEHRQASRQRHQRKMRGEVMSGLFEMLIIRKDGTEVPIELTSAYTTYQGKHANVAYIRDITERKRVEKELREAQEQLVRSERLAAIGQLAGGIGHELRNPLGAIKNAVYYIKRKVAKSELAQKEPRVMEFLDIMDDEVNSSNKIINDLLGFSRVGKPSVSPTQIKNVIEDAPSHLTIPENIELTEKLDADLPEVEIDAGQIRQVFINVIMNAVEAMPEGGRLTIGATEKDEFLEVEIADTGCGIPQETVDKIFDPLFTTKAKGTGLGLTVCKAIIDRHQGDIEVKSQVGKGTTFTIRLPLKAE